MAPTPQCEQSSFDLAPPLLPAARRRPPPVAARRRPPPAAASRVHRWLRTDRSLQPRFSSPWRRRVHVPGRAPTPRAATWAGAAATGSGAYRSVTSRNNHVESTVLCVGATSLGERPTLPPPGSPADPTPATRLPSTVPPASQVQLQHMRLLRRHWRLLHRLEFCLLHHHRGRSLPDRWSPPTHRRVLLVCGRARGQLLLVRRPRRVPWPGRCRARGRAEQGVLLHGRRYRGQGVCRPRARCSRPRRRRRGHVRGVYRSVRLRPGHRQCTPRVLAVSQSRGAVRTPFLRLRVRQGRNRAAHRVCRCRCGGRFPCVIHLVRACGLL